MHNQPRPNMVITARNVTLSLGDGETRVAVLKNVSLEIAQGDRVAIVGASGSGKTSLLSVLAGLERAESGHIAIDGQPLDGLDETGLAILRRGRVGIVPQSFHLIPALTALENVMAPLEIAGASNPEAGARDELAAVGLAGRASHFPPQLSGGEQQRVAIARALAPRPAILFADEPTGNLDQQTGQEIMDLLFRRLDATGATLLLITHDDRLASRCNRILHMVDGRLEEGVPH